MRIGVTFSDGELDELVKNHLRFAVLMKRSGERVPFSMVTVIGRLTRELEQARRLKLSEISVQFLETEMTGCEAALMTLWALMEKLPDTPTEIREETERCLMLARKLGDARRVAYEVKDREAVVGIGEVGEERWKDRKTRHLILGSIPIILVGWFIWRPLGVVLAIFLISNIRPYVQDKALFWGVREILIFGVSWGTIMGLAIVASIYYSTTSWVIAGILYFLGLLGVCYISYQPHAVFRSPYDKTEQAATTAWVCYVIVGLGTLAYYLLSHPERSFTF